MARREGSTIELIWVHLSLTHPRMSQALDRAAERLAEHLPQVMLSVNRNVANTEALVKVTDSSAGFRDSLPASARAAIIRVFDEADHEDAIALVKTEAWAGPGEVS